jgi:hypothetical protein
VVKRPRNLRRRLTLTRVVCRANGYDATMSALVKRVSSIGWVAIVNNRRAAIVMFFSDANTYEGIVKFLTSLIR